MKTQLTALLAVLASFVYAQAPLPQKAMPGGITEVSVQYSAPWVGKIYSVWLKSDGTAIFRGDHHVSRLGTFQARFPTAEFKKLAAYLGPERVRPRN